MDVKELGALQAYPDPRVEDRSGNGLTKRELFAAMAMQGICMQGTQGGVSGSVAQTAIYVADQLLAELAKERS